MKEKGMNEYEKLLDRMNFIINSTLMDNDFVRKGVAGIKPVSEFEILRSNQRTYMDLKVMMMRLEKELFGEKKHEEDETEISDRDACQSNNTKSRATANRGHRIGDISC
jgi:hypothetical protein